MKQYGKCNTYGKRGILHQLIKKVAQNVNKCDYEAFGYLNAETWQDDLKKGFAECWRVLDDFGTLVFKWSNSEIPFKKALELIPHKPLFYNTTNYKATSKTKWFCFMKIPITETET